MKNISSEMGERQLLNISVSCGCVQLCITFFANNRTHERRNEKQIRVKGSSQLGHVRGKRGNGIATQLKRITSSIT